MVSRTLLILYYDITNNIMYSNQFAGMYTELYILKGKTGREDQEPEGQSHPGGSPHLQRIRLIINLIMNCYNNIYNI